MRKKKSLITGITRQNSFYLTKYLLDKNLNTKAENFDYSEIKGFANIRDFLSADIIIKKILKILYLTNKPKIINIYSRRPTRIIDLAVKIFKNKTCDVNLLLKKTIYVKKNIIQLLEKDLLLFKL